MSRYDLVGYDLEDDYLGADEVAALLGAYDIVGATPPPFAPPYATRGVRAPLPRPGAVPTRRLPARRPINQQQLMAIRNQLVQRQAPTNADRIILPMTSSGNITASAAITARPQNVAYRPERIIVGGTPGNWLIDDIKVGNRSQFAQAGSMPAEAFAATSFDAYVSMETVQTAMDFVIQVTFVGTASAGEQFRGVVLGTAAVG